jgi:hypothetical protein
MICKPEEAKDYQCCTMQKACEGNKCMAWRVWHETDKASAKIATDKGYCGLAYKGK